MCETSLASLPKAHVQCDPGETIYFCMFTLAFCRKWFWSRKNKVAFFVWSTGKNDATKYAGKDLFFKIFHLRLQPAGTCPRVRDQGLQVLGPCECGRHLLVWHNFPKHMPWCSPVAPTSHSPPSSRVRVHRQWWFDSFHWPELSILFLFFFYILTSFLYGFLLFSSGNSSIVFCCVVPGNRIE